MRINQSIWSRTSIAVLILSFALATTPRANAEDRGNSNRDAAELFAVLPDGASGPEGLTVGRTATYMLQHSASMRPVRSPVWDSFMFSIVKASCCAM